MAPDLVTSACPRCAGAVRPGAPWCTQCFLDLRAPQPTPEAEPAPERQPALEPPLDGAHWPCTTCGAAVPLALAECPSCGAAFLAELSAAEPPLLVLPGLGDLTRLSRAQRLGLAFGLVLALLAVVLLAGYLLAGR